jgi:hypothetical protein
MRRLALSDGTSGSRRSCLPSKLRRSAARGGPGEMCGRARARECRRWRGEAKQDRRIVQCERRGGTAVGEAGSPERRRRARSTSGRRRRRRRRRRRSRLLNGRRSAARADQFCDCCASLNPTIYLKNRQKIHECDHRNHRIA